MVFVLALARQTATRDVTAADDLGLRHATGTRNKTRGMSVEPTKETNEPPVPPVSVPIYSMCQNELTHRTERGTWDLFSPWPDKPPQGM